CRTRGPTTSRRGRNRRAVSSRPLWAGSGGCTLVARTRRRVARPAFAKRGFMRRLLPAVVTSLIVLVLAACSNTETLTGAPGRVPHRALLSSGVPNTGALPDLIVDGKSTQNNWVTRVEDFPADFCSVVE